jgi:hypothetical protein
MISPDEIRERSKQRREAEQEALAANDTYGVAEIEIEIDSLNIADPDQIRVRAAIRELERERIATIARVVAREEGRRSLKGRS